MKSCIYKGRVKHFRKQPVEHGFDYSVFMMFVDLEEVDSVFDRFLLWSARRPALAWFNRKDHAGNPSTPLAEHIRNLVQEKTGRKPEGRVCLLTNFRYFGYCFNPISVYYCYDKAGKLTDVVFEVTNTPWKERHCYVLAQEDNRAAKGFSYQFDKKMHVSPFMDMHMSYTARLSEPGESLFVGMKNVRNGKSVFSAQLGLERQPINSANLAKTLGSDPFITLRVITLIHWQALKLWLKKVPLVPHPDKPRPVQTAATQKIK